VTTICASCGLAGHTMGRCPERVNGVLGGVAPRMDLLGASVDYLARDEVTPIPKPERREKRHRGLARVSPKRRREERVLEDAKRVVRERSKGRCEVWSWPHACTLIATEFHHRRRRAQGGDHSPENLVHVCLRAHLQIHDRPDLARREGLLIEAHA